MTVVGIIGRPVAHSLSPLMHNRAFAHLNMDWTYVPFEVADEQLQDAVAGLRALSVRGVNVTIPHKTAVSPFLDRLTEAAAAIGAVNTVVNDSGELVGDNTDGIGFVRSLTDEAGFDPTGARVLVVGAGGAARAVVVALARAGADRIAVANRTEAKARELAQLVERHGAVGKAVALDRDAVAPEVSAADVLVQTTSLGMAGDPSLPVDADLLHPGLLVTDIVYTPLETPLLRAAKQRGCRVLPGWGMLLYQGVEAFERWTDVEAPVDVMRETLLGALAARSTARDAGGDGDPESKEDG